MSDGVPNGVSGDDLIVVETRPPLLPSIDHIALLFLQESIPTVLMVLFIILLNRWEAKGSEADVPCGAGIILVQANLNHVEAEVLGDNLPGLGIVWEG